MVVGVDIRCARMCTYVWIGGRGGTCFERSGALAALAEPPYWMRMPSAHSAETFSLIQLSGDFVDDSYDSYD